jgi:dihydrofolate synthase/folylpolyglutamate synthase
VQIANAATTVAALFELADRLPLAPDALARGLARVSLPGRFQRVADTGFEWILDVAHNPAAARVLAENLRDTRGDGRTIAVCAMLADKDVQGVLRELADCVDLWIAASTGGERGLAASDLAAQAREIDIEMLPGGSLRDALTVARDLARHGDRIIVFGSFLSVGPALATLAERGLCALS